MFDQLFELNSLILDNHGVWRNPRSSGDFNYSDGSEEEKYLQHVFESASDLSIHSASLCAAIRDWVSLYHLSSGRANLLKGIKFPENAKILEVGCGCGAITRYLGELGCQVHAIEGSYSRANLARLRNRDLDNVSIIEHNFNSLIIPDESYDAVLFIGVLEYSKRFIGDENLTSEQSVEQLLKRAKASLTGTGVIIAAIENRMGLKYQKGAFEDHLAMPYVGIKDYEGFEASGIKTFDQAQLKSIYEAQNLVGKFYYPFPDYKLPALLINGEVADAQKEYIASQIKSADPISNWTMPDREDVLWRGAFDQNQLGEVANSFGLILAKNTEAIIDLVDDDWILFDQAQFKPQCQLVLKSDNPIKYRNNENLSRSFNQINIGFDSLNHHWLAQLASKPSLQVLAALSREAYILIQENFSPQQLTELDQLFVDGQGVNLMIAKSWTLPAAVTAEFQCFHLLLDFCNQNKKLLTKGKDFHLASIDEIIGQCFDGIGVDYESFRHNYTQMEQDFRQAVSKEPILVADELDTLVRSYNQFKNGIVNSQLFLAREKESFAQEQSMTIKSKQTRRVQTLEFNNIDGFFRQLRFDPSDHQHGSSHFIRLIQLIASTGDGKTKVDLNLSKKPTDFLINNDLEFSDAEKMILKINSIDPQIIFSLPASFNREHHRYNLHIKIQWLGV